MASVSPPPPPYIAETPNNTIHDTLTNLGPQANSPPTTDLSSPVIDITTSSSRRRRPRKTQPSSSKKQRLILDYVLIPTSSLHRVKVWLVWLSINWSSVDFLYYSEGIEKSAGCSEGDRSHWNNGIGIGIWWTNAPNATKYCATAAGPQTNPRRCFTIPKRPFFRSCETIAKAAR